MVKYAALVEGQPMDDLVKDHPILAKSAEFGVILDPEFAFIPEFADGLVGMKEGDQKTLEVSFPEDFIEPALAGKKAEYHVEALKVQVKVLPEVTPAFLKTLSVDSVEALRARIRADLVRMKQGQEKRRIQDEICKHLLEQTAMVLPESEVQRQTADEVYDLVQYNTNRGIDRNAIEENRDQIFSAAAKTAEEKLKLRFILLKLAAAEKLNVTNAEVDAQLRVLAQRAHRDFTKLKAELEKNNRLDEAREDVICSKALAYLLEQQQPQPAPAASSGRSDV